jgi:hypothetical protein
MSVRILPIIIVILLIGFWYISTQRSAQQQPFQTKPTQSVTVKSAQIGKRIKSSECQISVSLQDLGCTPGAINLDLTKEVLCSSNFSTKSVRNVPAAEKRHVYEEYGIASHQTGQYEVDHLISLELGGSNDIANLWPEAADPRPGFHEKDLVENYLHKQVCDGAVSLEDAQKEIATNWLQIYQSVHDIKNY